MSLVVLLFDGAPLLVQALISQGQVREQSVAIIRAVSWCHMQLKWAGNEPHEMGIHHS